VKRVDDSVFGEEQSLLLDHGIMIQPKGEQGADLLSRLARVMISVSCCCMHVIHANQMRGFY